MQCNSSSSCPTMLQLCPHASCHDGTVLTTCRSDVWLMTSKVCTRARCYHTSNTPAQLLRLHRQAGSKCSGHTPASVSTTFLATLASTAWRVVMGRSVASRIHWNACTMGDKATRRTTRNSGFCLPQLGCIACVATWHHQHLLCRSVH